MFPSWPVLNQACAELGLERDDDNVWHTKRDGVRLTARFTRARWTYVRFTARIEPALGIELEVGRLAAEEMEEGASLKEAGFRIAAADPQRARAVLTEAAEAIAAATACHHFVGVLDREVRLSGYAFSDKLTHAKPYVRDSTAKIDESLNLAADIARMLSKANVRLGPADDSGPPSAPRPVPRGAAGSMPGLAIAMAVLGAAGLALVAAAILSPPPIQMLLGLVGSPLAAIGLPAAALAWLVARRRKLLYRDGERTRAHVVATTPTSAWEWHHQLWEITYQLEDAAGQTHQSGAKTVQVPDVGEELWVIYDRNKPTRTVLAHA